MLFGSSNNEVSCGSLGTICIVHTEKKLVFSVLNPIAGIRKSNYFVSHQTFLIPATGWISPVDMNWSQKPDGPVEEKVKVKKNLKKD